MKLTQLLEKAFEPTINKDRMTITFINVADRKDAEATLNKYKELKGRFKVYNNQKTLAFDQSAAFKSALDLI